MTDFSKFDEYEISEKDIDGVLNYLKIFDLEHATPERAIEFLEYYGMIIHQMGHKISDEEFKAIYKTFARNKDKEAKAK